MSKTKIVQKGTRKSASVPKTEAVGKKSTPAVDKNGKFVSRKK